MKDYMERKQIRIEKTRPKVADCEPTSKNEEIPCKKQKIES